MDHLRSGASPLYDWAITVDGWLSAGVLFFLLKRFDMVRVNPPRVLGRCSWDEVGTRSSEDVLDVVARGETTSVAVVSIGEIAGFRILPDCSGNWKLLVKTEFSLGRVGNV